MRTAVLRRFLPACLVFLGIACGGATAQHSGAYIALGDSLSEGVGASRPAATGFVPLVHESLGSEFELLNLGHSGDTSQQLLDHGHLDRAVAEIEQRNGNGDASDDVKLVTLEIGGNDLLRLYFSLVRTGVCPDVATSLSKAECSDALASAFHNFEPNLAIALDRLHDADSSLGVILLTLYNPFSHLGALGELGDLSLEGRPGTPFPEGLNDLIRAASERNDVVLADVYPRFQGNTQGLISSDFIHPNDAGYRAIADAVVEAIDALRAAE